MAELESQTVATIEEATAANAEMFTRWTQKPKQTPPAPLTGKYAKLRDDLRRALEAGRTAEDANPEDGGTCNFDSPALRLPHWTAEKVKQAAKEAGAGCFIWNCCGTKAYVFTPNTRAQGNARTRSAEEMTDALLAMGYDAITCFQMD